MTCLNQTLFLSCYKWKLTSFRFAKGNTSLLSGSLCRPLQKLFTLSLETSDFPHRWKESFVIPLHKKESKFTACNYRGISKISAIPKLFQNIITPHLQHSCRSLISSCQHEFIKRRSTTTNFLKFTSFFLHWLRVDMSKVDTQSPLTYGTKSASFLTMHASVVSRRAYSASAWGW